MIAHFFARLDLASQDRPSIRPESVIFPKPLWDTPDAEDHYSRRNAFADACRRLYGRRLHIADPDGAKGTGHRHPSGGGSRRNLQGAFRSQSERQRFPALGEGEISISPDKIGHEGRLAPGPDYKLYLTTEFVDTKDAFLRLKPRAKYIGDVKSFNGFLLPVPADVDVGKYTTAVIWCESFSAFITAAKYR